MPLLFFIFFSCCRYADATLRYCHGTLFTLCACYAMLQHMLRAFDAFHAADVDVTSALRYADARC